MATVLDTAIGSALEIPDDALGGCVPFQDLGGLEMLSPEPKSCYHEGMPESPTPARLHSLSEAGVGLASPSGDQAAQRYSEQS